MKSKTATKETTMKTTYGNPLNWWLWTKDGWRVNPAAKHGRTEG